MQVDTSLGNATFNLNNLVSWGTEGETEMKNRKCIEHASVAYLRKAFKKLSPTTFTPFERASFNFLVSSSGSATTRCVTELVILPEYVPPFSLMILIISARFNDNVPVNYKLKLCRRIDAYRDHATLKSRGGIVRR